MTASTSTYGQEQMDRDKDSTLRNLLRKMSKKGFYKTLEFVCEKQSAHYSEILKYDLDNRIVQSRATITLIVRSLSKMDLIRRIVMDSRPIRTVYQPTEKGLKLMRHLKDVEQL